MEVLSNYILSPFFSIKVSSFPYLGEKKVTLEPHRLRISVPDITLIVFHFSRWVAYGQDEKRTLWTRWEITLGVSSFCLWLSWESHRIEKLEQLKSTLTRSSYRPGIVGRDPDKLCKLIPFTTDKTKSQKMKRVNSTISRTWRHIKKHWKYVWREHIRQELIGGKSSHSNHFEI